MPLTDTNPFDDTLALKVPNREPYDIRTLSWGTGVRWQDLTITAHSNNPDVAWVTGPRRNFIIIHSRGLDDDAVVSSTARIVITVIDRADSDNTKKYTIAVTVTPTSVRLPPSDTENNVDSPDDLDGNTVSGVDIYSGQATIFDFAPYTDDGTWTLTSNTATVTVNTANIAARTLTITGGAAVGQYAIVLTKGTVTLTIEGNVLAVPAEGSQQQAAPQVIRGAPIRLALGQSRRIPLTQYDWATFTGDSDIDLADLDFVSQISTANLRLVSVATGANNAYLEITGKKAGTLSGGARWDVLDEDEHILGSIVFAVSVRNVMGEVPAPEPREEYGSEDNPRAVEPLADPEAEASEILTRPATPVPSNARWELAHRSVGKVSEVTLEQGVLSFKCVDAHVIKGSRRNTIRASTGGPFQFVGKYSQDGIDVAWPESAKDQIDAAS